MLGSGARAQPALKKMGVIIEKTAGFLFRQGPEVQHVVAAYIRWRMKHMCLT